MRGALKGSSRGSDSALSHPFALVPFFLSPFFQEFDPDMIGLGPYIVQAKTPLGQVYLAERQHHSAEELEKERIDLLERTTRMYALARLILGNVNIAATTALQALDPQGRELALRRGANVVMPIITPQRLRGR